MKQIDPFPVCLFCVRDIYGVDVSRIHSTDVIYNERPLATGISALNTIACDEWAKLGDLRGPFVEGEFRTIGFYYLTNNLYIRRKVFYN